MPSIAQSKVTEEARGAAEGREAMVAVGSSRKMSSSSRNMGDGLLPGLLDEITLDKIVPRLPWTAFNVLTSVSHLWRKEIQRHWVHKARVRTNSTEKLLVLNHTIGQDHAICLFSPRDHAWLRLRPYRKSWKSQTGMPATCRCVSLDGKIYVLGGRKDYIRDVQRGYGDHNLSNRLSSEVYVLDVAGNRRWKQRASLPRPMEGFGCGVIDGKIYIFGGRTSTGLDPKPTQLSLVYDPKANAWSSVRPMKHRQRVHDVLTGGEELFVHGMRFHRPFDLFTQVYHPGRDEWRLLEPFGVHEFQERLFHAKGKLHMITPNGIYGHEIDSGKYSWTLRHSFTFTYEDAYVAGNSLRWVILKEKMMSF